MKMKKLLVLTALLAAAGIAQADHYYWVASLYGGDGSNWAATNFYHVQGGGAATNLPGNTDHVIIDKNWVDAGGGTMPGMTIPSWALAVSSKSINPDNLSAMLRKGEPPVIARIGNGKVLLDMRTLLDGDNDLVARALAIISQTVEG